MTTTTSKLAALSPIPAEHRGICLCSLCSDRRVDRARHRVAQGHYDQDDVVDETVDQIMSQALDGEYVPNWR